jgi:hypothetical protein
MSPRLVLAATVLSSCQPPQSSSAASSPADLAGSARTCAGEKSSWVRRDVGRDEIRSSAALPMDAARAESALVETRRWLSKATGVDSEHTTRAVVWLTTAHNAVAGPTTALTVSDATTAHVYLLSPSCDVRAPEGRFERFMLHELAGEYMQAATRTHQGWSFYTSPTWFVQGTEEWMVTLRRAAVPLDELAVATAERSRLNAVRYVDGAVDLDDDYSDGLSLVAWLHVAEGHDVLTRLLASSAPTFDRALTDVTGMTQHDVVDGYIAWRKR